MSDAQKGRRPLRVRGPDPKADLRDELRFHLEMRTQALIEQGMDPAHARAEALRRFGDVTRVRGECEVEDRTIFRRQRRREWWKGVTRDLRQAGRSFVRNPGFASIAVLTLALGIGANTAIFSVVNTVLLTPLPYGNPERLVTVFHYYPSLNELEAGMAVPTYRELRQDSRAFESVAVATFWGANFAGDRGAERLFGSQVSGQYFTTFATPPLLGRPIVQADVDAEARVVVLAHGLWQRMFGGRADAIGTTMQLDGEAFEIVGVMPERFRDFFGPAEMWAPVVFSPGVQNARTTEFLILAARLRPGVSVDAARQELTAFADRLKADNPGSYPADWTIRMRPLDEAATGGIRPALLMLLGGVAFVLLIACSNVASLLLARAASRRKEVAVRRALGADGGHLIRQFMAESLLLSIAGGALAVLLAFAAIRALVRLAPSGIPWIGDVTIDGTVLLFTSGVALLAGIVFGLIPAFQVSRLNLDSTLRQGGRGTGSDSRGVALRRALVVGQIALALTLLAGAGLLMRSFSELQRVDPGFNPEGLLVFNLPLTASRYPTDTARVAHYEEVRERLAAIPGVRDVAAVLGAPFSGMGGTRSFTVEGLQLPEGQPNPWGDYFLADEHYHRTMQIPLVRGRYFTEADRIGSPRVVIVDQEAANRFWPGEDPVGKRLAYGTIQGEPAWSEIVGVVGNTARIALDAERRVQVYRPFRQFAPSVLTFVVRTSGDPNRLTSGVRSTIRSIASDQPVEGLRPMEDMMGSAVAQRRFAMLLLALFAGIALLLASVGIYGVMSFDVARRSQEIGVRMALGARSGGVLRLVLGQGMRLAIMGVVIGLASSIALSRLISSQLYGIGATDPVTFGAVVVLLAGVAMLATLVPAHRATRVDPLEAIRAE